jgi:molybdenum cofactor cytidylyltransferase
VKFGPVPPREALGCILAHSERAEGRVLSKGLRLDAAHIAALEAEGLAQIVVARLEDGDVHEDAAADALAAALIGPGLVAGKAATGRVNLRAKAAGVVELDAGAIDAINRIDPAITVATVAPWTRLAPRGLAVTVKIIPFAANEVALAQAVAAGAGAVRLRGVAMAEASLIETQVAGLETGDKGRRAIKTRLDRFGVGLSARVVVDHDVAAIASALREAPGEVVMILTGSATSDAADTAPEALRAAGGTVIRYGMPVDPGNLLFLGRLGQRVVIGLPGCARSPALNGADWVMERVLCGVPPEEIDIAGMGVGGLLKEIPSRPRPRDGVGRP